MQNRQVPTPETQETSETRSRDLRCITRELEAARRILAQPDRHTNSELAYAEQRVRELGAVYMEVQTAQFRQTWANIQAWAADLTRQLNERTWPALRKLAETLGQAGLIEVLPTRPPHRRAELRASRQRARLSTQVPRHPHRQKRHSGE